MRSTNKTMEITAPNMQFAALKIEGTAPFVQLRFSQKAMNEMLDRQKSGSRVTSKKREGKDPDALFHQAMYVSPDGMHGIPCSSFRNAMVSACRLVGFPMTKGKLAFFIEPDGFDKDDQTPLVKITGEPHLVMHHVRNETGVADIRIRAMWNPGWTATVTIRYDADMFTDKDVVNLLSRVGMQVGVGEGRADSKDSCGMDWGFFKVTGGTTT